MLPKGFISRVIDHYLMQPTFKTEMDRAMIEFFQLDSIADFDPQMVSPLTGGLLSEWLLYDFILSDGRTMLQNWVETNPQDLAAKTISEYKELLNSQIYSFFEVLQIHPGQSLRLRNIFTDETYFVLEHQGTYDTTLGALLPLRLARYRNNWRIVSADSIQLPIQLPPDMLQSLKNTSPKLRLTPKDLWQMLLRDYETTPTSSMAAAPFTRADESPLDPETIAKTVTEQLKQFDIAHMVTVEQITQWLNEETETNNIAWIPALVLSLAGGERLSTTDPTPLLEALRTLANVTPRIMFDGKSPQDVAQQDNERAEPKPATHTTQTVDVAGGPWVEHHDQGMELIQLGDYRAATNAFKRAFRWLMEHHATERRIYCLFANAAVAHFACGQEAIGLALLHDALELNPNYTFGQNLLKKYQKGELPIPRRSGASKSKKQTTKRSARNPLAKHPAHQYMNWLRYLGVNFATPTDPN